VALEADPSSPDVVASRLVIIPAADADPSEVAAKVTQSVPGAKFPGDVDDAGALVVEIPEGSARGLAGELIASGLAEAVDYDVRRQVTDGGYTATPNDPIFTMAEGWGLKGAPGTGLASVWPSLSQAAPGSTVPIAVIDSSFTLNYPDRPGWLTNRWDAADDDLSLTPDNPNVGGAYHGAYVASVIASIPNNGVGTVGAAWDTPVWCYKVASADGTIFDSAIIRAIDRAVRDGAKVINMSVGGSDHSAAMETSVRRAQDAGIVVVAAAGNEGLNPNQAPHYPAAFPGVLSVSALQADGTVLPTSNHDSAVDLAAPGAGVGMLAEDGELAQGSGTSFAAPLVASAAALLRRHRPDLGPEAIAAAMTSSARDIIATGLGRDDYTGHGALDAPAALARIKNVLGPAARLRVTADREATLADSPITATVEAWDLAGHPVSANGARLSYSLDHRCTFRLGTAPAVRTCTVTAQLGALRAETAVGVFDVSDLRRLAIHGTPTPGQVLSVAIPEGWPQGSIGVQWLYSGVPVPGATAASHTVAPDASAGTVIGVVWALNHRGLSTSGLVDAQAVVTVPPPPPPAVDPTPPAADPTPAATKRNAKVTVQRKGRDVIVRVKAAGTKRPTGKVAVRFGAKVKSATLKAKAKGVITIRAPKSVRGKVKVTAIYAGTATIARAKSTAKRMTFR
jgi:hypothetical protein